MYDEHTVGVVVPAYNEEGHVGTVIETVPAYVDRVYVVDDASTDGTWTEIREYARRINASDASAEDLEEPSPRSPPGEIGPATVEVGTDGGFTPRVVSISHETNRGAGAAVKTGYSYALADGIDVVGVMDGDGQMDPNQLERIIEPVIEGEVTYAKGNRLRSRGDRKGMSRWRLFGNGILTFLTRISSGYWELSDPQNGFTAISKEGLRTVQFDRLYDRYGFLNHLLLALNVHREPVADVSHPAVYADETSSIEYSTFIPRVSLLLARNFIERVTRSYLIRRFHPLIICYVLGVFTLLAGMGGGLYAVSSSGVDTFLGGMTSLAVGVLGGLLLTLGMWFDVSDNEGLVTDYDQSAPDLDGSDARRRISPDVLSEAVQDGGRSTGRPEVDRG